MVDESASDSWPSNSASGSASIVDDVQQVKGLTFVTARLHIIAEFGEQAWSELMDGLPRRTRALFDEAELNAWYPEGEMRRFIHLLHEQLAGGDDARFLEIVRGLAGAGISRFFRMLMNLASGSFVLRKVPVVWKRLRRGPASLHTEVAEDGRVLVHYRDYRFCRDPIYRLLSIANCQALVVATGQPVPAAEIVTYTRDSMTLAFQLTA